MSRGLAAAARSVQGTRVYLFLLPSPNDGSFESCSDILFPAMKTCCLVAMLVLMADGKPSPLQEDLVAEWSAFKTKHNRMFASGEEERTRFQNFALNFRMIAEHNQLYEKGLVSFSMRINHFADQSRDDRRRNSTIARPTGADAGRRFVATPRAELPSTVDWRERGYVTEVKNQDKCGACWSFSATGALEGQHFKRTGRLVSLSEQNLIDCSGGDYGNQGCDGGDMGRAFQYVIDNRGIDSEQDYPFEKKGGRCRYAASQAAATADDLVLLEEGDESQLRDAVAGVGPVSVGIDASPASFDFYGEGVYFDERCSSRDLDHAVLVVGYGEQDGREFWLIKNSWGPEWGQAGYMRLARGRGNHCGVATYASYPLV